MDAKYVLTLVHGTKLFGSLQKTPAWVLPGSEFATKLRGSFEGEAETYPFEWSGWNTLGARRKAAKKLCVEMNERIRKHPENTRHVLVCHSHGGNVALCALASDDGLRESIAGVACLATPFLTARMRQLGWDAKEVAVALAVTIALAAGILIANNFSFFAAIASVFVASAAVQVLKWGLAGVERLKGELRLAAPEGRRLLIVRSPADEASLVLAFFQFVSWITVKFFLLAQQGYAWIASVAVCAAQHKLRVAGVALAVFACMIASIFVYAANADSSPTLSLAGLYGFFVLFIVFALSVYILIPGIGLDMVTFPFRFVVMLLTWPLMLLLSLILLVPLGPRGAVGSIFLEISAESTPPGEWLVHLIEPPPREEKTVSGEVPLRHSIYDNPNAQALIIKWAHGL